MKTNDKKQTDLLENLFKQMPEAPLPASFRSTVMQQILAEAARVRKRNERWGLIAIIAASAAIFALAALSLIYLKMPQISLRIPDLSSVPFYLYIGALGLLLLWFDHLMRKRYKERHKEEYPNDNETL